jgi:transposase-like protein
MANDPPDEVQRWAAKRRVALVVRILKRETSVPQAARKHGLTLSGLENWQERFLLGAGNGLRARPKMDVTTIRVVDREGREPRRVSRRPRYVRTATAPGAASRS